VISEQRPYARKVLRSVKHLDEIKAELKGYEGRHPYVAVRDRKTDPNPRVWTYRAHLGKKPTPDLALMVGDAIHNLRTALDYIVAELVPNDRRGHCKFPIVNSDIFATDPETGQYLNRSQGACDRRCEFESAVLGMDPDAASLIYKLQPGVAPYEASTHPLAVLSALDNADKHRELTTIARGIREPVTVLRHPDFTLTHVSNPGDIVEEGGIVAQFKIRPRDLKTEISDQGLVDTIISALADGQAKVDVKIAGTPEVAIKIAGVKGLAPLPGVIEELGAFVWEDVLTPLDWYVEIAEASR
jgi:hypothetical protein